MAMQIRTPMPKKTTLFMRTCRINTNQYRRNHADQAWQLHHTQKFCILSGIDHGATIQDQREGNNGIKNSLLVYGCNDVEAVLSRSRVRMQLLNNSTMRHCDFRGCRLCRVEKEAPRERRAGTGDATETETERGERSGAAVFRDVQFPEQ